MKMPEPGTEADFRWRAYQCRTNADAFDLQAAGIWDLAADALRDARPPAADAGEVRERDTSGFDLMAAIIRHMDDDLSFVADQMPAEDLQRFYRLRDEAREWLIAEGARIDATLLSPPFLAENAKKEGFREGVEAAAKVADELANVPAVGSTPTDKFHNRIERTMARTIAKAIRAIEGE